MPVTAVVATGAGGISSSPSSQIYYTMTAATNDAMLSRVFTTANTVVAQDDNQLTDIPERRELQSN